MAETEGTEQVCSYCQQTYRYPYSDVSEQVCVSCGEGALFWVAGHQDLAPEWPRTHFFPRCGRVDCNPAGVSGG